MNEKRGRERVASRELEGWLIETKGPSVVEEQSRTGAIGERSQCKKKAERRLTIDTRNKIDYWVGKHDFGLGRIFS